MMVATYALLLALAQAPELEAGTADVPSVERAPEHEPPPPPPLPSVDTTRYAAKRRMLALLLEKDALQLERPSFGLPVGAIVGSVLTGGYAAFQTALNVSTNSWDTYAIGGVVIGLIAHVALGVLGPWLMVDRLNKRRALEARCELIDREVEGLLRPPPSLLPREAP